MSESEGAPKSAYELAMERLKKKDAAEGVADVPLSEEQRQAIAEVRKVYEARIAEREILYQSSRHKIREPEAAEGLEAEYRRDRERLNDERERKIEEIRKAPR